MNISEVDPILHYNFKGTYRDVGTLLFYARRATAPSHRRGSRGLGRMTSGGRQSCADRSGTETVPRQAKMRMWYHIPLLAKMLKTRRLRPLCGAVSKKMKMLSDKMTSSGIISVSCELRNQLS